MSARHVLNIGSVLRYAIDAPRAPPATLLANAGAPPSIDSTTSTIYAYDDDGAASPGATEGCGGGVSTGLAVSVEGNGGVEAGFFLKNDVRVRCPPFGFLSIATGSIPGGGSTLLCFFVPPKDTSLWSHLKSTSFGPRVPCCRKAPGHLWRNN